MNIRDKILEVIDFSSVLLEGDGFDDCIVGTFDSPKGIVAVYDYDKLINCLIEKQNMTFEDAKEYYEYNIERAIPYMGALAPIIINLFEKI